MKKPERMNITILDTNQKPVTIPEILLKLRRTRFLESEQPEMVWLREGQERLESGRQRQKQT